LVKNRSGPHNPGPQKRKPGIYDISGEDSEHTEVQFERHELRYDQFDITATQMIDDALKFEEPASVGSGGDDWGVESNPYEGGQSGSVELFSQHEFPVPSLRAQGEEEETWKEGDWGNDPSQSSW
jgi:hypothetical protein